MPFLDSTPRLNFQQTGSTQRWKVLWEKVEFSAMVIGSRAKTKILMAMSGLFSLQMLETERFVIGLIDTLQRKRPLSCLVLFWNAAMF